MDNKLYLTIRDEAIKVYLNTVYPLLLKHRAIAVGKKDKIKVVLFAMNEAMWRYQGIYELLSQEDRFDCHIVLTVANNLKKQQCDDLQQIRRFFRSQSIEFYDYDDKQNKAFDVKKHIDPDIVFYPQPYRNIYPPEHDFNVFSDKLLCYIPYSIIVVKEADWVYDLRFHNLAWKIYLPLKWESEMAAKVAKNKGSNVVTSGYLNLGRYLNDSATDVWKVKDHRLKRLIWAPHFSVDSERCWLKGRANFLWLSQLMLEIADQYKDLLQIAFKPHPRLKTELYDHPDWGKDKTDRYYERWNTMENTQLEMGDFVDLFMTSDAMIHDSGSFTAEYLYVNKPVAFTTKDINSLMDDHSEFGRDALKQHYVVGDEEDLRSFIDNVIIGGIDPMAQQRTEFFETVLKPNVTGTTSQFIVNDIKKSLHLNE